ncbi:DNA polymerase III subunit gamma/tau [Aurantimonas sp. MSK8Z-1]|uniref:DNA polymerase III subunit gamma/tau n=1 Tax=Mangrovibrevibacter kandeliae TaxID=2968473 RepID=UPI002117CA20|nr:DNA polymerase III subunit gamma/tau [Aurantimonas sp. MSK8Z-1]MCW4116017.1 DNA polymerase III subunit gamma/tau [Aurantimonas sp. MSK8Z-1]
MSSDVPQTPPAAPQDAGYRVLARKYRPRSFDDLIGQAPMVRTLTNAFETGRIAQAWMLTGVRGVGKTTTARILARALNYQTDTIDQPTVHLAEPGIHCQAIMEGRHVDVVEMDAASHTGIDDIREITAQVRYRPVSARYKVYIIDEVHMLSTQAFNGLLKTLEEPPEHAKFIFATTEIRKVPITVLSRCQRFDLRRIETATLVEHLRKIAAAETVAVDDESLRLVARAAEGSVRDALSLMDQAIAHGAGQVESDTVRAMLGLADRSRIIDLFEMLMRGDGPAALGEFREQYRVGADPVVVLSDLADFTHVVTTLRFVPDAADEAALAPAEIERGRAFATSLSVRSLSQVWQMLLKAIEEVRNASAPRQAAEMALIRIAHAADLPAPEDLLRALRDGEVPRLPASRGPDPAPRSNGGSNGAHADASAGSGEPMPAPSPPSPVTPPAARMAAIGGSGDARPRAAQPSPAPMAQPGVAEPRLTSLDDIAALAEAKRDSLMQVSVRRYLRPVKIETGRIEIALTDHAPRALVGDLARKLHDWTGRRWVVSIASGQGGQTIEEREAARKTALVTDAGADPEVAAILQIFPGAKVVDVRLRADGAAEEALAPVAAPLEDDAPLADPDMEDDMGFQDDGFDPDDDL